MEATAAQDLGYERLDQLTAKSLPGARCVMCAFGDARWAWPHDRGRRSATAATSATGDAHAARSPIAPFRRGHGKRWPSQVTRCGARSAQRCDGSL